MKIISYFANNRGRGKNNVTLYYVTDDTARAGNCAKQDKLPYIAKTTTSAWRGQINASRRVMENLGLENARIISNYRGLKIKL